MKVTVFQPEHSELRKYIECFYHLEREAGEIEENYITFPTTNTIVVASQGTRTLKRGQHLYIHAAPDAVETNIVGNFTQPVFVHYTGAVKEITTYFTPLGLNAFLPKPASAYKKNSYATFAPLPRFKSAMREILTVGSIEHKVKRLEAYWHKQLHGFEHPFLQEASSLLLNATHTSIEINQLCEKLRISRVTLGNAFKTYIGITPSQFKKIARFRHAIEIQKKQQEASLSDLTYSLDYFDQSHMIKEFKLLTGMTPRKFFTEVGKPHRSPMTWRFL